MNSHRYLIRIATGDIANWDDPDEIKFQRILSNSLPKCFDLKDSEHSVYEVADATGEALVVAAYSLANQKPSLKASSVIRIRYTDLTQFGIGVDQCQLGNTGVCWVDHRHRNLMGTGEQITQLVQWIATEAHRKMGQDRVRRILKFIIANALTSIISSRDEYCPRHVKRLGEWAMNGGVRPQLDRGEVEREMGILEFDDEVVAPLAWLHKSGDQAKDWYEAIQKLRAEYASHYLPLMCKRYDLR